MEEEFVWKEKKVVDEGGERTQVGFMQSARGSGRREEERRRQRQERFPTPSLIFVTKEEVEEDAIARESLKARVSSPPPTQPASGSGAEKHTQKEEIRLLKGKVKALLDRKEDRENDIDMMKIVICSQQEEIDVQKKKNWEDILESDSDVEFVGEKESDEEEKRDKEEGKKDKDKPEGNAIKEESLIFMRVVSRALTMISEALNDKEKSSEP
ncbi:hypothetical protein L1987_13766 [Smallanthus sonchifolius]|uniref:Uncharacterized protein n=1 Tax=Smallanthus sonchifolius TaxID=185202 RepID=A0ACB9JIZ9_9ASTR|nr:hypothetical protein L1987_13766 [Smallanthus sonchifolius]